MSPMAADRGYHKHGDGARRKPHLDCVGREATRSIASGSKARGVEAAGGGCGELLVLESVRITRARRRRDGRQQVDLARFCLRSDFGHSDGARHSFRVAGGDGVGMRRRFRVGRRGETAAAAGRSLQGMLGDGHFAPHAARRARTGQSVSRRWLPAHSGRHKGGQFDRAQLHLPQQASPARSHLEVERARRGGEWRVGFNRARGWA